MNKNNHQPKQNGPTPIAEFVRKTRLRKGYSLREVVNRARAGGHRISIAYLSEIERDRCSNPRSDKLKSLACGLDVAEMEILEASQSITLNDQTAFHKSRFWKLYEKYNRLPKQRQRKAEAVVEALDRYLDQELRGIDEGSQSRKRREKVKPEGAGRASVQRGK